MSVQYVESVPTLAPIERRRSPRFRFSVLMPAVLGRGDALIADISADGARVMHFTGHPLDSQIRLVCFYAGHRFGVTARVLASRVIGLGSGPGGSTSYESRLQFVDCPPDSAETLAAIIEHIENERLRNWVSNAAGDGSDVHDRDAAAYFVRCRLRGRHWTKCWTREEAQPADGFTVPAKLSDGEIDLLCEAYEKMDDEGRELIRMTARASGGGDQSALPSHP